MKTVDPDLLAHASQEVTTLCTCWCITRTDGQIFRFTDHDVDLSIDGDDYASSVGYQRTALANAAGPNVSNSEVQLIFDSGGITQADVRAGKFDFATVLMFAVNWADPSQGQIKLRKGFMGELTMTNQGVGKGELRGLTQVYARRIVEIYSPHCRADLGDARCGVDLSMFTVAGEVTEVADRRTIRATLSSMGSPGQDPVLESGYYDGGLLTFDSGANAGIRIEVKQFLDGLGSPSTGDPVVILFLPEPYDIQVGDTFTLYPGCDKQFSTCRDKFNNTINFRGEPYVPGTDVLMNVSNPG